MYASFAHRAATAAVLIGLYASHGGAAEATARRQEPSRPAPAASGRDGGQGAGGERACLSLADGRGEKVLIRKNGAAVRATFDKHCPDRSQPAVQAAPAEGKRAHTGPAVAVGVVRPDPGEAVPGALRVDPERLGAGALTGGTALWLLHSGFWTSLLLLGLPVWRHVDLLPIVERGNAGEICAPAVVIAPEERAVSSILAGPQPQRGDPGAWL